METTNIRIYKKTHERLKEIAEKRRQQLVVVLDELVNEKTNTPVHKA